MDHVGCSPDCLSCVWNDSFSWPCPVTLIMLCCGVQGMALITISSPSTASGLYFPWVESLVRMLQIGVR